MGDCESGRDMSPLMLPKIPREVGVDVPDVFRRPLRVSEAARRRRLVVPSALVEPDLAEHTMATLFPSM